ncbi:MAG: 50S ribosomal protein L6 [Bacteroides sp. SM23_62]|jgi:large subunit ribosomal protein L6|nr:MAG: 50S ribosomal protein L6 [Bacteroides sp. SM23_62]
MSRIGYLPINIPEGVSIEVDDNNMVVVKGPKGELSQQVNTDIRIKVENGQINFDRPTEQREHKAMHGLYRSLVNNMVIGVSQGYEIKQELVGVGFRAEAKGQRLEMSLGYSHDVVIELPHEVKVEAYTERRANPIITLRSADKQLLGHVAAKIRSLRPPEPYKGKGIKFVGEQLRRKAGKAASV